MKRTVLLFAMFLPWSLALFAEAPEFSLDPGWPKMPEGWKFRMVSNIAGDSKGRIYVAHRGEHPVVYFDKAGKFLGSLGDNVFKQSVNYNLTVNPPIPISREYWVHGIHVDPWDNVWVTDLGRQVVMKLSREGKLLMTLGTLDQSGESPKNFHQPSSVAVATSGDIYVADGYGNSRVVKFSPEGKYLKTWGKKGSGPGEFDTPHGIAIDAKGNVYVAERLNNRVQVFDSEGRFLAQWLNHPRADSIFINKESQAYVGTGKGDTRIYRLDLSGRLLGTIGTEKTFGYPHGIFVDSEGSLYIADPIANSASQPPRRFVKK